jgi:CBS domain containing-hemolysin-like protein
VIVALVASAFLIVVNGVFVAMEFAMLASLRTRIEPWAAEGRFGARDALAAMRSLGPTLAGTQLGVTIASLALGSLAEPRVESLFDRLFQAVHLPHAAVQVLALVVSLSVVVFLHLLFGEMVPKSIALAAPERTLVVLAAPVRVFVWLLRPVIVVLNLLARLGARALGAEPSDELRASRTAAELAVMLEESTEEGLLGGEELELLTGAMDLVDRSVAELMVPAARIVSVPAGCPVEEAEDAARASGHSRLLVVDRDLDHVVGFIHVKDLLRLGAAEREQPLPVPLRAHLSVAPSTPLGDVLVEMQLRRIHLAVVGEPAIGTVGMITLEDVLESMVGEIVDESDREAEAARAVDELSRRPGAEQRRSRRGR